MTNDQAAAYAFIALRQRGYSKKHAMAVYNDMRVLFDMVGEEEAEERAAEWLHED